MKPNPSLILAAALALGIATSGSAASANEGRAPDADSAPACLTPAAWTTFDGERPQAASPTAVLTAMAKRDAVLLGEHHDEADHHRWQAQVLAALHAQRPHMVIGFEMFPRGAQRALDRWVAGELTVKQFLDETEWERVWGMSPELYLPLFQFARINRIPMVALNIDQKLTKAIAENGWDSVPEAEREGVGRAAPPVEAYVDFLFRIHQEHAEMRGKEGAKAERTDPAFRHFVESQTAWDRAMAEALARHLVPGPSGGKPLVVGVLGSGHIRFGQGVPHQLSDLGVRNVGTLMPLPAGFDCEEVRGGLADAVFAVPKQAAAKPEPPRLGVRLEEHEGTVRILEVTAGSLAERTGLKSGDRLVDVAGVATTKVTHVVAMVRQQPPGTWLPLQVKRGEETLDLVVKFPPKP